MRVVVDFAFALYRAFSGPACTECSELLIFSLFGLVTTVLMQGSPILH
jgi:hypothetical protein